MITRFTSKVLVVTVVPVITTAIILASILVSGRINEFNDRINEYGQNLVNYLAPISEYGVLTHNFDHIESTFQHAVTQPDIAAIYILDENDSVITARLNSFWDNVNFATSGDNFQEYSSNIYRTRTEIDDLTPADDELLNNIKIGSVKLIMSLSRAKMMKLRIIKDGMFITLISIILTILVALLFARSVTRPITVISDSVNIIKDGDLSHRIPIDFVGEIATLAQGINNMSSSLEVAQIKEKQRAEDALFIEKTKAQITLAAIGEGVITTDVNGIITYINPAAEYLTGYDFRGALNKPLSSIFVIKDSKSNTFVDYPVMECITNGTRIHHESDYILVHKNNTEYTIRETTTPLLDKENNVVGAVLVFHDFTSIKKMSDILTYQATHDELTSLLNRRAFESKLNTIINSIHEDQTHALCYIDLDQFKVVNDTCGHIAGDNLLKLVASIINKHTRKNDLLARLGGDEFGLVLYDCDTSKASSLAENIRHAIENIDFEWEGHPSKISCSIGITAISFNANLTDIMMAVDTACYTAKDHGRNQVHVYSTEDKLV